MIVDLAEVEGDPFAGRNYDICICGGGVAGISLALNLPQNLRVLLLEAGGYENSVETQSVYEGDIVGQQYADLRSGRLRFLGGSSNHWAGDCRPLDEVDFERKDYVQYSGWPITKQDLDPYLEQAESLLELSGEDNWDPPTGHFEDDINRTSTFQSSRFKFSPPTRFGERYRRDIARSSNIHCYLNANVTELVLAENSDRLSHAVVQDYDGGLYNARADKFVLATGGIENPRILLNCDRQVPGGLGNQHGNVGRFFNDHLFTKVGDVLLEEEARNFVEQFPFGDSLGGRLKANICAAEWIHNAVESIRGTPMYCLSQVRHFYAPTPALMHKDRILNFSLRMRVRTPGHGEPIDGKLFISSEQAVIANSTVSLSAEKDRFGLRRVRLDWQLSDIDYRTMQLAAIRFGETFAAASLGRIRPEDWLNSEYPEYPVAAGNHHMCATRMGEDPVEAVVDSNQRVFGTENLYMAGASVFSTGGHANPTLTIVQMTLRLAEHLHSG